MMYRLVRESQAAGAVVWTRTSRSHPGEWFSATTLEPVESPPEHLVAGPLEPSP
jgi:hypothetical protein